MRKWIAIGLMLWISSLAWGQEEIDQGDFAKSKGWKKYELTVHLTTGRTVEIKSKFNIDFCNKVMFLYDNKGEIIYPQNTTFVERKMKDGTVVTGYPTDSLWLFPVFTGNISGYSTKPETKMKFVEHLIKKGEEMKEYDIEILRQMLFDNPEAYAYYEKYESRRKRAKIINSASFIVGLMHVFVESPIKYNSTSDDGTTIKKDFPIYPIIAGGGVVTANLVIRNSNKNLMKAIKVYNSQKK